MHLSSVLDDQGTLEEIQSEGGPITAASVSGLAALRRYFSLEDGCGRGTQPPPQAIRLNRIVSHRLPDSQGHDGEYAQ
jgi:hypothetical protein